MTTTEGFRVHPIYKTVELRHPGYPEDAPPLIVEVRRNLLNNDIDNLPSFSSTIVDGKKVTPTTTIKDVRDGIAQYVKSWNLQAENDKGEFVAVPAPMDGGGDVFKLLDDHFLFEIYWEIWWGPKGGRPGSQEADDRKNSSAASSDSPSAPDAATHATNTPTPIRGSSTGSTSTTSKARSPKKKTS